MHANDFSLRSWKWKFSIYSQRLPCCHDSFNQLWDHVNERTVLCVKRLRLHNFHLSSQFTFTVIVYAITGVITNKVFLNSQKMVNASCGYKLSTQYFSCICIISVSWLFFSSVHYLTEMNETKYKLFKIE